MRRPRPADQVAVLVSRLRGVLGRDRIPHGDGGYRLVADWSDLEAFDELAGEARRRLARGDTTAAHVAAGAALALVRGPLLADEDDGEWADGERRASERRISEVFHLAAQASFAVGDHLAAIDIAGRALEREPYDESALRVLMAAYVARGRPASALSEYARVRQRLAEDLGVDPSPETEAMHTAILRNDVLPGFPRDASTEPLASEPDDSIPPGRDAVFVALDRIVGAPLARPVIVELAGEAGIGKSMVLDRWSRRLRARGTTVLSGRCDELERALPLQVVIDALAAGLHALSDDDAVAVLGAEAAALGPLLLRRVHDADGPTGALTDAETSRLTLFAALRAVVQRWSERSPIVFALDDMHLAGRSTVDWLRYLATHGEDVGVAVVAARRPDEGLPLPADTNIELGPLDRDAVAAVVGGVRADDLLQRTGGHPLFLVELAAADDLSTLPTSIVESVAERCDRAGEAGATLRTAAVIGSDVDLDLLAAVTHQPPVTLLGHLEDGVRRRFLVERNAVFAFAHDLVRDAARRRDERISSGADPPRGRTGTATARRRRTARGRVSRSSRRRPRARRASAGGCRDPRARAVRPRDGG